MSRGNIVVVSSDYRFKISMFETLKYDVSYNIDVSVLNLPAAQTKFVKNMPNVLVIDLDSHMTEHKLVKILMEKHFLYVITVGSGMGFNDPAIISFKKLPYSGKNDNSAVGLVVVQKIKEIIAKAPAVTLRDTHSFVSPRQKVIAIGSSTGGTEALPAVLSDLPGNLPPILIVQHMPSVFTKQFADRMDKMSVIDVKEAADGEFIKRGTAYIAPGDYHMRLVVRQQKLALECFFADRLHGVRPAADILFESIAKINGGNAIGIILTGMGSDGARGLVEMHKRGAKVIGQNKETCVVYGMPKVAYDLGAVDFELPLPAIAGKIKELAQA